MKKQIALCRQMLLDYPRNSIVISDENYLFFHHRFAWNYIRLAELYPASGEYDKSILFLEKAFTHAKLYDNLSDTAKYTAPY